MKLLSKNLSLRQRVSFFLLILDCCQKIIQLLSKQHFVFPRQEEVNHYLNRVLSIVTLIETIRRRN